MKDESDTTVLLDYTQAGDWGEESRRLRQHLAAAQNSDEYNFRRWQDTLAQRDKAVAALRKYGIHPEPCASDPRPKCTCGLDAALKEFGK
jgi:hypothetical protein